MKGPAIHDHIRALGFQIVRDRFDRAGFFVNFLNGSRVGFYELCDDGAFRFAWLEHSDSIGRTDCNSWPEFIQQLTERRTP